MLKCEPVDLPVGRWFGAEGGSLWQQVYIITIITELRFKHVSVIEVMALTRF